MQEQLAAYHQLQDCAQSLEKGTGWQVGWLVGWLVCRLLFMGRLGGPCFPACVGMKEMGSGLPLSLAPWLAEAILQLSASLLLCAATVLSGDTAPCAPISTYSRQCSSSTAKPLHASVQLSWSVTSKPHSLAHSSAAAVLHEHKLRHKQHQHRLPSASRAQPACSFSPEHALPQ